MRTRTRFKLGGLALAAALVGGVAYATIPDDAGVYTACTHRTTGAVRLIDPSLGDASLLGRCNPNETLITWSQRGPQGERGTDGTNGTNGISPTVSQLPPGNPFCTDGGAAITDASGTTAYVCAGPKGDTGAPGTPFSGTFTSANGNYSISVGDTGIELRGPGPGPDRITLAGGSIEMHAPGSLLAMIGNGVTIRSGNQLNLRGDGLTTLRGATVTLNGPGCQPAARLGDVVLGVVDPTTGVPNLHVGLGSPTVCIGG